MSNKEQTLSIIKPDAVERNLDNGMFARFEGSYSDYENIELKSTGSDAVSTISGDIETITARISIGKSF